MNKFEGTNPELQPFDTAKKKAELQKSVEAAKEDNQTLDLRAPKIIGAGSENAVALLKRRVHEKSDLAYESDKYHNFVAKVDIKSIQKALKANKKRGLAPGELSSDLKTKMEDEARKEKARKAEVKNFFPDYQLHERYYVKPVPVNAEIFAAAAGKPEETGTLGKDTIEVPAIIRFQEKVAKKVLEADSTLDIASGYKELDGRMSAEQYHAWNQDLIVGNGEQAEDYLRSLDNPKEAPRMATLIERAKTDPAFQETLRNFATTAMDYTISTGQILDVFGKSNIYLHEKPDDAGQWTMTFIDEIYPGNEAWKKGIEHLKEMANNPQLNTAEAEEAMTILNYVRDLNALAAISGADQRLKLPVSIDGIEARILEKVRASRGFEIEPDADLVELGAEDLSEVDEEGLVELGADDLAPISEEPKKKKVEIIYQPKGRRLPPKKKADVA